MATMKSGARLERRGKTRFPMEREMRYRLMEEDCIVSMGYGSTVNMSSNGVLFKSDRHIEPGTFIELSISWPAMLDGNTPMRLVTFGQVVRNADGSVVCSIDKHEFRTGGARPLPIRVQMPMRADSLLRRWAGAIRKEQEQRGVAFARPRAMAAGNSLSA